MIGNMLAWLAGFRIVEEDAQHTILRLPWWARKESVLQPVMRRLAADAELQGYRVKFTHGHRLLRVDIEGERR